MTTCISYQAMLKEIARKMIAELEIEIMLKAHQMDFLKQHFLKEKQGEDEENEHNLTEVQKEEGS